MVRLPIASPETATAQQTGLVVERFREVRGRVTRTVVPRGAPLVAPVDAGGAVVGMGAIAARRFDAAWLRARRWPRTACGPVLRWVDLFAGCGGLSLGAWEAARALGRRPDCVLGIELADAPLAVFRENFPRATTIRTDICSIIDGEIGARATRTEAAVRARVGAGEIDLLVAGPPCQGHSNLNNHTRRQDPKNELYLRVVRFVELCRPHHVVIENVPEVRLARSGVVQRATAWLEALGYSVDAGVVVASAVGLAQRRRRHLLLASSRDAGRVPSVVELRHEFSVPPRSVDWAIGDLRTIDGTGVFDTPATPSEENQRRIQYLFARDEYDLPNSERPPCHREKVHSYYAVYGRLRGDQPAPTITGGFGSPGQGRFIHPHEPRTLTPHEAARLQGFPDFFRFPRYMQRTRLQEMIGNAVPPRLGYCAVVHLLR